MIWNVKLIFDVLYSRPASQPLRKPFKWSLNVGLLTCTMGSRYPNCSDTETLSPPPLEIRYSNKFYPSIPVRIPRPQCAVVIIFFSIDVVYTSTVICKIDLNDHNNQMKSLTMVTLSG